MTHTWVFFFVNFSGVNRQVTSIWVFDKVTWKKLELMKHTISSSRLGFLLVTSFQPLCCHKLKFHKLQIKVGSQMLSTVSA